MQNLLVGKEQSQYEVGSVTALIVATLTADESSVNTYTFLTRAADET